MTLGDYGDELSARARTTALLIARGCRFQQRRHERQQQQQQRQRQEEYREDTYVDAERMSRTGRSVRVGADVGRCGGGKEEGMIWSYPIKNGLIADMAAAEPLIEHVVRGRLGLSSPPHPHPSRRAGRPVSLDDAACVDADSDVASGRGGVLVAEAPFFNLAHRCRLLEHLFESLSFERAQLTSEGALAIFAAGQQTGVAVECGHRLLRCCPIYEGYPIPKAQTYTSVGGHDVTMFLSQQQQQQQQQQLISGGQRGGTPQPLNGRRGNKTANGEGRRQQHQQYYYDCRRLDIVRRVTERHCYVAVDPARERRLARDTAALEKVLALPDGATLRLSGDDRFTPTEVLFSPAALAGVEAPGLSELVWQSLQAADIDLRGAIADNIVLSGGSSMFPGLSGRLQRDLDHLSTSGSAGNCRILRATAAEGGGGGRKMRCRIEDPPRRRFMVFLGGAALAAATAATPQAWMTAAEWMEGGEGAVYARFEHGGSD